MKRIITCPVALPAFSFKVDDPWHYVKQLLDQATIEMIELEDGVTIFFDEDGRAKELPPNRTIPARAPDRRPEPGFTIDLTGGQRADPGEMGEYLIQGPFILTRLAPGDVGYFDLTEADVKTYLTGLNETWLAKHS